jgi:hypothetical protein
MRTVTTWLPVLGSVLRKYHYVTDRDARRRQMPKRRREVLPAYEWGCGRSARGGGLGRHILSPCSEEHARAVEQANETTGYLRDAPKFKTDH